MNRNNKLLQVEVLLDKAEKGLEETIRLGNDILLDGGDIAASLRATVETSLAESERLLRLVRAKDANMVAELIRMARERQ